MSGKFYKLGADLAARRDLTPADKLVYAVIANRIGANGYCWPGVRTLARDTGLNKDTVLACRHRLEKVGDLQVDCQGRGSKTTYRLPGESVRKTRTVTKNKVSEKSVQSVRKTRTLVSEKSGHNRKNQKRTKREREKTPPVEIPPTLDTPEFQTAWAEWRTYRREIKKPLAESTAKRQLKRLEPHGPQVAVAMLTQSIERGWVGIFDLKGEQGSDGGNGESEYTRAWLKLNPPRNPTEEDLRICDMI